MPLDKETTELVQRLKDLEDRLISEKIVEESVYNSIKTLSKIFGRKSMFTELLERLKSEHKVRRLDAAARRAIKETEVSIEVAKASAEFPHVTINKNSFLADYLANSGRIPFPKLRAFHTFFAKFRKKIETAFEQGDPNEVKSILREYVHILEDEEEFLKQNSEEITRDIKYAWSIHNAMGHEVAHWVWGELTKTRNRYGEALNEGYSFALQKLMHTFEDGYTFTKKHLLSEARELYKLIVPRKHGYPKIQYTFMRPFIIFIGILVLCDSIGRKDRDFRNKKLFIQSYSVPTILRLFRLIEEAIDNLKRKEYRELIQKTLLKTGINQLRRGKGNVIEHLEKNLDKLPGYAVNEIIGIGVPSRKEKWKSFNVALGIESGGILNNNLRQFVGSLDLLRIMGYEGEAREYKERYIKLLKKTLDKVAKDTKDKDSEIYKNEQDAVDGIINVIDEEEKDLLEIVKGIKF